MTLRFTELAYADIIRDGGSYEAKVVDDEGDSLALLLAVDAETSRRPGIIRHRGLYVRRRSTGAATEADERIERRSEEERELLSGLLRLAASLESTADQLTEKEHGRLERFYELLAHAKTRGA